MHCVDATWIKSLHNYLLSAWCKDENSFGIKKQDFSVIPPHKRPVTKVGDLFFCFFQPWSFQPWVHFAVWRSKTWSVLIPSLWEMPGLQCSVALFSSKWWFWLEDTWKSRMAGKIPLGESFLWAGSGFQGSSLISSMVVGCSLQMSGNHWFCTWAKI